MAFKITHPKGKLATGFLEDACLLYVKVQTPEVDTKYKKVQFSVQAAVCKKDAIAYRKAFPENKVTKMSNSDFTERFKIEPPFEGKFQFVVRFVQDAKAKKASSAFKVKAGEEYPYKTPLRPKVFIPGQTKGKVKDITMDKLVSNGSIGNISFAGVTGPDGGQTLYPRLRGVLVTEFIEYVQENSSPFGSVEEDDELDEDLDDIGSGGGFGDVDDDNDDDLSEPDDLDDLDDDNDDLPLVDEEDDDEDDDFDFDD